MKNFCESLREYEIEIINFKKKKNEVINKRAAGIIWKCNYLIIFVKKYLKINIWKIKKYCDIRKHCHYRGKYRGTVHSISNLKNSVLPIVFHNGSNYDYHFIMNKLVEESKNQFTCLGEKLKKYINFTVLT